MISLDRITLRDAVFFRMIRRPPDPAGFPNALGSVLFQFQDGQGNTIFEVDALDWSPGMPIIHNNIEEIISYKGDGK